VVSPVSIKFLTSEHENSNATLVCVEVLVLHCCLCFSVSINVKLLHCFSVFYIYCSLNNNLADIISSITTCSLMLGVTVVCRIIVEHARGPSRRGGGGGYGYGSGRGGYGGGGGDRPIWLEKYDISNTGLRFIVIQ